MPWASPWVYATRRGVPCKCARSTQRRSIMLNQIFAAKRGLTKSERRAIEEFDLYFYRGDQWNLPDYVREEAKDKVVINLDRNDVTSVKVKVLKDSMLDFTPKFRLNVNSFDEAINQTVYVVDESRAVQKGWEILGRYTDGSIRKYFTDRYNGYFSNFAAIVVVTEKFYVGHDGVISGKPEANIEIYKVKSSAFDFNQWLADNANEKAARRRYETTYGEVIKSELKAGA